MKGLARAETSRALVFSGKNPSNIGKLMPIFSIRQNKLQRVKEVPWRTERDVQRVVELNLKEVFGLELVKSELSIGSLRIDTLAFDADAKSFVVMEYKKDKSFSVIDQGYAYLAILLNNKSDFILEYNEARNKNLRREDIDWSQSKVVFVSPQFTKYQKQAISFRDLPIELWEVNTYENSTIAFTQLTSPETSESITRVSQRSEIVQRVNREIRIYTEDDHLHKKPDNIKGFYEKLKERILSLGNSIEVRPKKYYIGFVANTNFADVHLKKSKIKMWLNLKKGALEDPKKIARDVSKIGHWGNGDYEIHLKPTGDDLDYITLLIKQSYQKHS